MFRVAEMRCHLSNKACQRREPRQARMAGWQNGIGMPEKICRLSKYVQGGNSIIDVSRFILTLPPGVRSVTHIPKPTHPITASWNVDSFAAACREKQRVGSE